MIMIANIAVRIAAACVEVAEWAAGLDLGVGREPALRFLDGDFCEFGGLKLDQAKRLKELEKENSRLKRLVAELSLEKQVLRDVAQGNF
jgi:hypothetical protein